MMYKLLIVDDEDWIRERLKHTIDWGSMDVEVIGEACDGEEALEKTKMLLPDIVLTDIRMPCINGLEYIKRLRDGNINVKVIIISGFSDFDYARNAIKLGAFDYILKPVDDDDLTGVIKRCIEDINAERSKNLLFIRAREQMKESLPLMKRELFINLVNEKFSSEEEIAKEFSYLGVDLLSKCYICFIMELNESVKEKEDEEWDKHLSRFVMCNIAQDFLNKLGKNEIFFSQKGEAICLVFSKSEEKVLIHQVLSISNGIRKMIKRITGCCVTIGVGRTCSTLPGIAESYREAGEALQYKSYLGLDRIYDIRSIDTRHKPSYYKSNDLEILLNNIKIGNKKNALDALDTIIKGAYKENSTVCPIDLKLLYMDIINSVFKTILEVNTSFDEFSDFSIEFIEQLNRIQTIDEIHRWLADSIMRIIDVLGKYKSTKKRKVVEKALEYINTHYTESITLNSVADKFFMNASYFCTIFREEMGESFTRYFMNLRIQKAKELMNDPTLKIYEVAAKVGYDDVQYFTKIFKSIMGVTPMQFREKIK